MPPRQSVPRLRRKKQTVQMDSSIRSLLLTLVGIFAITAIGLTLEYNREAALLLKKGGAATAKRFFRSSSSRSAATTSTSHLLPLVPVLPAFAPPVESEKEAAMLEKETISGKNPTMAGLVLILQTFLIQLHLANQELMKEHNGKNLPAEVAMQTFYKVANKYIRPFEQRYKGELIFPIRKDENSIFLSLAAYREHLLADTLQYAFKNAKNPDKLYVGAVVQNCFGKVDSEDYSSFDATGKPCRTGLQVTGKDKAGRDMTKMSDAPPDINGIDVFCNNPDFKKYCDNGQIRVLYVHSSGSLGPAMARYHASKLWGGETYFMQCDSHLQFAEHWDAKYIDEIQATSNYPKSILSSYPPGFQEGHGDGTVEESPGARLCRCETIESSPNPIVRLNVGRNYNGDEERPTQIPFIAAGFFFARAEFLRDVPFDPYLPWCFMGEEIALSVRAWTSGWDIYAPRKNWIVHQYRPGRLGLPKFWESVNQFWHQPGISNAITALVIRRIKHMVQYPDSKEVPYASDILLDLDQYGFGSERSWEEYMKYAELHTDETNLMCNPKGIQWCNQGLKD